MGQTITSLEELADLCLETSPYFLHLQREVVPPRHCFNGFEDRIGWDWNGLRHLMTHLQNLPEHFFICKGDQMGRAWQQLMEFAAVIGLGWSRSRIEWDTDMMDAPGPFPSDESTRISSVLFPDVTEIGFDDIESSKALSQDNLSGNSSLAASIFSQLAASSFGRSGSSSQASPGQPLGWSVASLAGSYVSSGTLDQSHALLWVISGQSPTPLSVSFGCSTSVVGSLAPSHPFHPSTSSTRLPPSSAAVDLDITGGIRSPQTHSTFIIQALPSTRRQNASYPPGHLTMRHISQSSTEILSSIDSLSVSERSAAKTSETPVAAPISDVRKRQVGTVRVLPPSSVKTLDELEAARTDPVLQVSLQEEEEHLREHVENDCDSFVTGDQCTELQELVCSYLTFNDKKAWFDADDLLQRKAVNEFFNRKNGLVDMVSFLRARECEETSGTEALEALKAAQRECHAIVSKKDRS